MSEHLAVPFETVLLGQVVTVEDIDVGEDGAICARCRAGRHKQLVSMFHLPDPAKTPEGWEWVEVYRRWCRARF